MDDPTNRATDCSRRSSTRTRRARSNSPDLVRQEIWGHLCCHYAIRTLMWEAAGQADVDPDRVSFVAALHRSPQHHSGARFFPLTTLITDGAMPSCCFVDDSTRHDVTAPTRDSSNASTSNGMSNAPDIITGHNQPAHQPRPSPDLTERHWG